MVLGIKERAMRTLLLRITTILLAIVIVGVSLSLLVGRFLPADLLTTTLTKVTLTGNRYSPTDILMLIDLNRHIRLPLYVPVEGTIQMADIHWRGQQVLIHSSAAEDHMYHYN